MVELDLDTLKKIFEGLAIVQTITERNSKDIAALDSRDQAAAERNATAIRELEARKNEAVILLKEIISKAKTDLGSQISDSVGSSNHDCEARCQVNRKACPVLAKKEFLDQLERDKWYSSKISKFWWTIGTMILGALLGGLFKELLALVF
jgi:hypothetical protein